MNKEPAFPVLPYKTGMNLRDYFAAKALRSAIEEMWATSEDKNEAATIAYQYADAMMKAREKDET
jgi:hypothetical protein